MNKEKELEAELRWIRACKCVEHYKEMVQDMINEGERQLHGQTDMERLCMAVNQRWAGTLNTLTADEKQLISWYIVAKAQDTKVKSLLPYADTLNYFKPIFNENEELIKWELVNETIPDKY